MTDKLPPELEEVVEEVSMGQLDFEALARHVLRRAGVADLVEERNRMRRRDCGTEDDVCLSPNTEPLCHACDYSNRKEEEIDALREERDALREALKDARPVVANAVSEEGISPWQVQTRSEILDRVDAVLARKPKE